MNNNSTTERAVRGVFNTTSYIDIGEKVSRGNLLSPCARARWRVWGPCGGLAALRCRMPHAVNTLSSGAPARSGAPATAAIVAGIRGNAFWVLAPLRWAHRHLLGGMAGSGGMRAEPLLCPSRVAAGPESALLAG